MPRLYPAEPVFGDGAQAERAVWEVLEDQLPADAALFYGVRLLEGNRHEVIDLLVAWPRVGIAAIEVTGGTVVRGASGWTVEVGSQRDVIDPVGEVVEEEHMLHRILASGHSPAAKARFVHLLALPHTPVPQDWTSPELTRDLLIARDDLGQAARLVRQAIKNHGHGHGSTGEGVPLSQAGLEDLVDWFGAQMPSQVAMLRAGASEEARLGHMTHDQAKVLDLFEHYPRLAVVGGAGSGKTWLALEQARRRAKAGDRVALICRSRGLSRFFQRVVDGWDPRERPAFVGIPQDLLAFWGRDPRVIPGRPHPDTTSAEYWSGHLPTALFDLAVRRPVVDRFDALLLDEAEEFGDEWWPALAECLREPQVGVLVTFSDSGSSDMWRRTAAPIDVAPLELSENLRSTRQIARLTSSFSLGELLPRGRKSVAVRYIDAPAEYAPAIAEDVVVALEEEGWDPGQIAVLTTATHWATEQELTVVEGYRDYWDRCFDGHDVHRGGVRDFQGLERQAVVLVVNGFEAGAAEREILYTGLSRARSLLVVVGPIDLIEKVGGDRVRKRLRKADAWTLGEAEAGEEDED